MCDTQQPEVLNYFTYLEEIQGTVQDLSQVVRVTKNIKSDELFLGNRPSTWLGTIMRRVSELSELYLLNGPDLPMSSPTVASAVNDITQNIEHLKEFRATELKDIFKQIADVI